MTGDFSLRVKFSLVGEGAQPVTLVAQQSERGARSPKVTGTAGAWCCRSSPGARGDSSPAPRKTPPAPKGPLGRALRSELPKCKMSREGKPSVPFVTDRTTLKTLFTLEISVCLVFYCTNLIFPVRPPRLAHGRYWEGRS